jgi:tRNA pseudouridine55 synthase
LGGGAHLRDLRRTAIGSFTVTEAKPLEALTPETLLNPADAMRDLDAVTVDADVAADIAHGKVLDRDRLGIAGEGPWAMVGADGTLLAVYETYKALTAKPAVVLGS